MQNNYILPLDGKLKYYDDRLIIIYYGDILEYYRWHIQNFYNRKVCAPTYGAHTSIHIRGYHRPIDPSKLRKFHNRRISIKYDPFVHRGGITKGFTNFYLYCGGSELEYIYQQLGMSITEQIPHITIGGTKGMNPQYEPYFKPLITIQHA